MLRLLWARQTGVDDAFRLQRAESTRRVMNLELSKTFVVERRHEHSITTLDLDPVEMRFMISADSEGLISIYHMNRAWDKPFHSPAKSCPAVASISGTNPNNHKFMVQTVQWYPHDTGMFTSSSFDKTLKVWDTNSLQVADIFKFANPVHCHHMSPIATKHCLVAVGTSNCRVQLCDLKSGSSTHTLYGHQKGVLAVRWSTRNEYLLATGSEDNQVRIWDVRKASAFLFSLDQHSHDVSSKPKQRACNTAHNGHVNGLCFTHDGLHLLTSGTDHRLRLWNTATGEHVLVNYGKVRIKRHVNLKFCISSGCSPNVAFVPTDSNISVLDIHSGQLLHELVGHYGIVNCCVYHPLFQEVYSAGSDCNILVWTPDLGRCSEADDAEDGGTKNGCSAFQDTWSCSEDEG
uniref:DNA excision repair protein ERCC-8 n=1 Tax=Eptatretus burgeri TaxID=7764 RepID=A0A8C4QGQ3_EPTBU